MSSPYTPSPSPAGPAGGTTSSPTPAPSAQGPAGWQPPSQPPLTQSGPQAAAQPAAPASPGPTFSQAGPAPADGSAPTGTASHPAGQPTYPAAPYPAGYQIQPGIIPLRPLSVTEILSGSFNALRANPAAMFLPSLAVMAVLGLLTGAASYLASRSLSPSSLAEAEASTDPDAVLHAVGSLLGVSAALTGTTVLASTIGTAIITGLIIVTVSRSVLGRVITPGEAWERTRRRVPALIGQSLLVAALNTLIMVAAAAVCVAVIAVLVVTGGSQGPGLVGAVITGLVVLVTVVLSALAAGFVWVRLSVTPAALVLENIGVIAAIRRSWQLTRGSFWHVLGTLLLAALITATASGVLSGAIGVATSLATHVGGAGMALVQALVTGTSSLLTAITLPFYASAFALTYIDLRMRREGLDLELRQVSA